MGQLQTDQLRRYVEIKQSDMPSAVAAKKTKEFRCPPRDQMNTILGFKNLEEEELEDHACSLALRGNMSSFHDSLMRVISIASLEEEDDADAASKIDPADLKPSVWKTILKAIRYWISQVDVDVYLQISFCLVPGLLAASEPKVTAREKAPTTTSSRRRRSSGRSWWKPSSGKNI